MIDRLRSIDFSQFEIEVVVDGRNRFNAELFVSQEIYYRGIDRKA